MKLFICLAILAFVAFTQGRILDKDAKTISYKNKAADAKGNYHYSFETSNDIQIQEAGNSVGVTGEVNYISPEGTAIELTYTADEDGYHPVGKHLPTPPPLPDYIRRSLEYIRSHPPPLLKKGKKRVSRKRKF